MSAEKPIPRAADDKRTLFSDVPKPLPEKSLEEHELSDHKEQKKVFFPQSRDDIPEDVFLHTLHFSTPQDVAKIAVVGKSWKDISNSDSAWRAYVKPRHKDDKNLKQKFLNEPAARLDRYLLIDEKGMAELDNQLRDIKAQYDGVHFKKEFLERILSTYFYVFSDPFTFSLRETFFALISQDKITLEKFADQLKPITVQQVSYSLNQEPYTLPLNDFLVHGHYILGLTMGFTKEQMQGLGWRELIGILFGLQREQVEGGFPDYHAGAAQRGILYTEYQGLSCYQVRALLCGLKRSDIIHLQLKEGHLLAMEAGINYREFEGVTLTPDKDENLQDILRGFGTWKQERRAAAVTQARTLIQQWKKEAIQLAPGDAKSQQEQVQVLSAPLLPLPPVVPQLAVEPAQVLYPHQQMLLVLGWLLTYEVSGLLGHHSSSVSAADAKLEHQQLGVAYEASGLLRHRSSSVSAADAKPEHQQLGIAYEASGLLGHRSSNLQPENNSDAMQSPIAAATDSAADQASSPQENPNAP